MIIFLAISFNMCFECSKEPSHRDRSFEYPQHMFWMRRRKLFFNYILLSGGLVTGYSMNYCPVGQLSVTSEQICNEYKVNHCDMVLVNPFKLNGISHSYKLDQSISFLIVVGWHFSFLFKILKNIL